MPHPSQLTRETSTGSTAKADRMSRGIQRERAVRDYFTERDYIAFRAPASLGCADVIALKAGQRPQLVEVKSTAGGPYERFQPADRDRLAVAARMAA